MNPDDRHPDYTTYVPVWQKCRDAAAGQRAIKLGAETYLKPLAGQIAGNDRSAYDSYLDRANYFNATGRTIDAMVGMVFRKPMTVEVPDAIKLWLDDITLSDETLTDFAQTLVKDNLTVGRAGILVEQPQITQNTLTLAERQALGSRPYLVLYKTESIFNWEYALVNNRYKLVNIRLAEWYKNEKGEQAQQIRQLSLDTGVYVQTIWRKGDGANWVAYETITPLKNNVALTEIPFFPVAPDKPTLAITEPPIESLADVNISHYKNSADLENGAHIAGMPTAYITGVDDTDEAGKKTVIYLGSSTILTLPLNATAGFLQCGSEGFATIEKLMESKVQMMAALGARMLAPEKKQAEAAQAHEIKRGGENSILSSSSATVARQLTKAIQFMAEWEGIAGEIAVELNTDYIPVTFTAQDLTAWTAALQAGAISKETYFDVLKYSEWLPDERTFEEEQERIASDGPPLGTLTDDPASANDNGDS